MTFSKVTAYDEDAIAILQILQEGIGGTSPETCAETRHRGTVSYTGLVLNTNHTKRVKELGDKVVFFVIECGPT